MTVILFAVYFVAGVHSSFNQAEYLFESFLSSILWFGFGALCMHLVHTQQTCRSRRHRNSHVHRKDR